MASHSSCCDLAVSTTTSQPLSDDIRRYVGESLIVTFDGLTPTPEITTLLRDYFAGNVVLRPANVDNVTQTCRLVRDLQSIARTTGQEKPLFVAIEQDGPLVLPVRDESETTLFPGPLCLSAASPSPPFRAVAEASGKELAAIGINLVFLPWNKILSDVTEPLDASKTFSDNAKIGNQHILAFTKGLNAAGIANCQRGAFAFSLQHAHRRFAGLTQHDDDEQQELEGRDLADVQTLLDHEILDSMMLGSLHYNFDLHDYLQQAAEDVRERLIRGKLNFQGPIVIDISIPQIGENTCIKHAPVRTLLAGANMVKLPPSYQVQVACIEAIYVSIQASQLSSTTCSDSALRIRNLKSKYLSWQKALDPLGPAYLSSVLSDHAALARTSFRRTATIVHSTTSLPSLSLPFGRLSRSAMLILLTPTVPPILPNSAAGDPFEPLGQAIARFQPDLRIRHVPYSLSTGLTSTHVAFLHRADALAVVLCNTSSALNESLLEFVSMVKETLKDKSEEFSCIMVGAGDPRDIEVCMQVFGPAVNGVLCFEYSRGALEALAEVLVGIREAVGISPISLKGV